MSISSVHRPTQIRGDTRYTQTPVWVHCGFESLHAFYILALVRTRNRKRKIPILVHILDRMQGSVLWDEISLVKKNPK